MSIEYYDIYAERLIEQYESLQTRDVHRAVLDQFPNVAAKILDVGAGSGRDAAWLAGQGHQVVAVEPADAMRQLAEARHGGLGIQWIDDTLPELRGVYQLNESFDAILLSAVWMHLPPEQRETAMRRLVGLLEPGGKLIISTRTAPYTGERTLYRVDIGELAELGEAYGLRLVRRDSSSDLLERDEVRWSTVVFDAPDDGTAALPVLRNIIVNDDKSSTYKLGLLRVLARIAAASPGLVDKRDDGFYDVPLGLVALVWAKTYWPLEKRGIQQQQSASQQSKFRDELLAADEVVSPYDVRIGNTLAEDRGQRVHALLREIRDTIRNGPAHYTTYAGTREPIFVYDSKVYGGGGVRSSVDSITLGPNYFRWFGALRVPAHIFEAMLRHWAWIEPTVLNEWVRLMSRWEDGARKLDTYYQNLYWTEEDEHDTTEVAQLVMDRIAAGDPAARAVWRDRPLRKRTDFEVDHCIPYSVWFNNSLWNLLPATPQANNSKSDRLPAAPLLAEARPRILKWWDAAFLRDDDTTARARLQRFAFEAHASLPGAAPDPENPDLPSIFSALQSQIRRIRRDQQIEEWAG